MNRAFMKDPDDAGRPEPVPDRPLSPHPNYVTPAGLRQLEARVAELAAARDRLVDLGRLADAQELAVVNRDLRYYEARLARAIPVVHDGSRPGRVCFGSTVEVGDEAGRVETYTLVGEDEADPALGRISWVSPLAEALLNAEPGDEVVWRRPAGTKRLEILGIRPGQAG